ncbi:MAG: DEAD/DEAH box helicase [Crocinitomicaceae bacterium]|nr:DEAD/DEAH box helicase [Crocinitomicaceae bacterium]
MSTFSNKTTSILNKLGILKLNQMQEESRSTILSNKNTLVLSPTGSGKTLAFLLPIIDVLDKDNHEIQALVISPTRELAIQIEQVTRSMGTGFKANAVYGGRSGSKDREELKKLPAILIGTPGRIADRIRRDNFSTDFLKIIIFDEFDKSLEIGFENEMREIAEQIPLDAKKIFTSATNKVLIPEFIKIENLIKLDYLKDNSSKLKLKLIAYNINSKNQKLLEFLQHVDSQKGIIFCNYKQSIYDLSDFLEDNDIKHACFHGDMEQYDRERALIKFRNNTYNILVASDLAARGIDIDSLNFICHFEIPDREEEFIHRNGRTARMNADGTAFVFCNPSKKTPDFLYNLPHEKLHVKPQNKSVDLWETLFISGGRKDKISKGDIAGFFIKKGKIDMKSVGKIEIKHDCSFVAISNKNIDQLIFDLNNQRIKKKKIRIKKC